MTPSLPSPPPQPDAATPGAIPNQYRKLPVVITATQWFKHGDHPAVERVPLSDLECDFGWVKTLEGGHMVTPGDWIITGVKGEHYPCKPDIFTATYEPAPRAPTPPGTVKAEAVESALHAALAERDANAQTAKAMSKLHDEAEKEIEELHATIARLTRDKDHLLTKEDGEYIRERLREAVKAEAGQGVTEAEVEAGAIAIHRLQGECLSFREMAESANPDFFRTHIANCREKSRAALEAALAVRGKHE